MADNEARRAIEIARLNDELRRTFQGGDVLTTRGIVALGEFDFLSVMDVVMTFDEFTPDNDPFGEHDCGVVIVNGIKIIWKIDYYDKDGQFASPDPADQELTRRVLAIMLAEEY